MSRGGRNNRLKRTSGRKRYKRRFILATEGAKTEPLYFQLFDSDSTSLHIEWLKSKDRSAPSHVLKRMRRRITRESLRKTDSAWLVVDKDQWTDEQLRELYEWSKQNTKYGLAVSNPKFEYWLLLHFEDGNGLISPRTCEERLKRYMPDYDKSTGIQQAWDGVKDAIARAKQKEESAKPKPWPQSKGSTVYKLAEKLLEERL